MEQLEWGIGDVVRKLRNKLGRGTIKEFARAQKMDPSALGRLERGGNSDPTTVRRAADGLGVSVAELHALVPVAVRFEITRKVAALVDSLNTEQRRNDALALVQGVADGQVSELGIGVPATPPRSTEG